MDTKLTLKLDREIIERTKRYAERHGVSLSEMVEHYFAGLTRAEESPTKPTGVVAELAGLLKGKRIEDSKESYADYLVSKYS